MLLAIIKTRKMFHYYTFGLNISSEIKIPGMIEISNKNFDVEICFGGVDPSLNGYNIDCPNYDNAEKCVYLCWDKIGKFKIENGNLITVDPVEKIKISENKKIIPFLLGPVMGNLLCQRGFLVLHGSSVKLNQMAVAFIGGSGVGKSTLALTLYKKGYTFVSDDILAIDFVKNGSSFVYPSYPHSRQSEQSYNYLDKYTNSLSYIDNINDKIFVDVSRNFDLTPIELKNLYLLEKGEKIQISKLKSQELLLDLVFHSPTKNYPILSQVKNLNLCTKLINNTNFRRLQLSHSFKDLNNIVSLLEKDFLSTD